MAVPISTRTPSLVHAPPSTGCCAVLLPHQAVAVPSARRAVVADLSADPSVTAAVDAVAVVVSELLGNAVRHAEPLGEGDVLLRWWVEGDAVRIEVVDGGGGALAPRDATASATTGRGLRIVEALASDWGCQTDEAGRRTVWASVPTACEPGDLAHTA